MKVRWVAPEDGMLCEDPEHSIPVPAHVELFGIFMCVDHVRNLIMKLKEAIGE